MSSENDFKQRLASFRIDELKQFALNGWKLGPIHGISHWTMVERNAILLSSKEVDGELRLRDDVNIRVVRCFAYLHDKCRQSDGGDFEHGPRAAEMIPTIRETILKDLTDEEIALLREACNLHTSRHRTGNPTIDVCFDADRLDLGRVGIEPSPCKMATAQGAFYAQHPRRFRNHMELLKETFTDLDV